MNLGTTITFPDNHLNVDMEPSAYRGLTGRIVHIGPKGMRGTDLEVELLDISPEELLERFQTSFPRRSLKARSAYDLLSHYLEEDQMDGALETEHKLVTSVDSDSITITEEEKTMNLGTTITFPDNHLNIDGEPSAYRGLTGRIVQIGPKGMTGSDLEVELLDVTPEELLERFQASFPRYFYNMKMSQIMDIHHYWQEEEPELEREMKTEHKLVTSVDSDTITITEEEKEMGSSQIDKAIDTLHAAFVGGPASDAGTPVGFGEERKTDRELLQEAVSRFPCTFGLRAFPGETFFVSTGASFIGDNGTPQLYVYKKGTEGSPDLAFSKGTEEELKSQIVEAPEALSLQKAGTLLEAAVEAVYFWTDDRPAPLGLVIKRLQDLHGLPKNHALGLLKDAEERELIILSNGSGILRQKAHTIAIQRGWAQDSKLETVREAGEKVVTVPASPGEAQKALEALPVPEKPEKDPVPSLGGIPVLPETPDLSSLSPMERFLLEEINKLKTQVTDLQETVTTLTVATVGKPRKKAAAKPVSSEKTAEGKVQVGSLEPGTWIRLPSGKVAITTSKPGVKWHAYWFKSLDGWKKDSRISTSLIKTIDTPDQEVLQTLPEAAQKYIS